MVAAPRCMSFPRACLVVGQPFQAVVLTGWKAGPWSFYICSLTIESFRVPCSVLSFRADYAGRPATRHGMNCQGTRQFIRSAVEESARSASGHDTRARVNLFEPAAMLARSRLHEMNMKPGRRNRFALIPRRLRCAPAHSG